MKSSHIVLVCFFLFAALFLINGCTAEKELESIEKELKDKLSEARN